MKHKTLGKIAFVGGVALLIIMILVVAFGAISIYNNRERQGGLDLSDLETHFPDTERIVIYRGVGALRAQIAEIYAPYLSRDTTYKEGWSITIYRMFNLTGYDACVFKLNQTMFDDSINAFRFTYADYQRSFQYTHEPHDTNQTTSGGTTV